MDVNIYSTQGLPDFDRRITVPVINHKINR